MLVKAWNTQDFIALMVVVHHSSLGLLKTLAYLGITGICVFLEQEITRHPSITVFLNVTGVKFGFLKIKNLDALRDKIDNEQFYLLGVARFKLCVSRKIIDDFYGLSESKFPYERIYTLL